MRMTLLGGLLATILAVPALARNVSIATAIGPAAMPASPDTGVVYDIAALATLTALCVNIEGVTDKVYLDSLLPIVVQAQVVGTLFKPDFEALAVMQPDLIVAGGRLSMQVQALSDFAPTIDMTIRGNGLLDQARAHRGLGSCRHGGVFAACRPGAKARSYAVAHRWAGLWRHPWGYGDLVCLVG